MDLRKLKEMKWNYLAIAFGIPVAGMLVLMIIAGAEPFGQNSMLYSDMYHQYYPFFKAFRRALLSGDSQLERGTGYGLSGTDLLLSGKSPESALCIGAGGFPAGVLFSADAGEAGFCVAVLRCFPAADFPEK